MTYDDMRASAFEDFCPECLIDGEFTPIEERCSRHGCEGWFCNVHVNDHDCPGRDE